VSGRKLHPLKCSGFRGALLRHSRAHRRLELMELTVRIQPWNLHPKTLHRALAARDREPGGGWLCKIVSSHGCPPPRREVLFEGLRKDEILNLPKETIEQLVLIGEPLVFRVGSAVLLGSFKVEADRLVIELAHIEGGGEGVLVSLASLTRRDMPRCMVCRVLNGLYMQFPVPNQI
jgi:hypothetical protein